MKFISKRVPNAPCGVERWVGERRLRKRLLFLMHRVELKVSFLFPSFTFAFSFLMHRVELKGIVVAVDEKTARVVPNAPCGVESSAFSMSFFLSSAFLMHRVELKVFQQGI